MTDTRSGDDGAQIFNFPRTGFTLAPTTDGPGTVPPPPVTPPVPAVAPTAGPGRTGRRSPLDTVAALPEPGLTLTPVIPTTIQPGQVPDTFRPEPSGDLVGPRLGALSLAAILAVAVAALRGTHTVLQDWRQRRLERATETAPLEKARLKHQLAMQGLHDKAAEQRTKNNSKVPSSSEFGRKTAGGRSGAGGGAGKGPGSGGGRSKTSGASGSGGTGPGRKKNTGAGLGSGGGKNRGSGGGKGPGGKPSAGSKTPRTVKPKSPHRPSQGGGLSLKKKPKPGIDQPGGKKTSRKDTPGSGGRTGLTDALGKTTNKAAARRLKRRRKNLDNPALWSDKNTQAGRRNKKDDAKQKNGKNTPGGKQLPPGPQKPGRSSGRTTLADAVKKAAHRAARKRLKKRRRTVTPPIWTAPGNKNGTAKTPKSQAGPKNKKSPKSSKNRKVRTSGWWAKARQRARAKATKGTKGGCFDDAKPTDTPGSPGSGTSSGRPGGSGTRNTPFGNAGQAAGTTYTAERADYPGAQARQWHPDALTTGTPALPATGPAALDAVPTPHTARPGTTRTKDPIAMPPAPVPAARDPRIRAAQKASARAAARTVSDRMDPQHATEITLDDAIDQYGDFKDDAFKTHDKCLRLAGRARELRDVLATFAEELAVKHNLIGALFGGAMLRLSESMELLARMADEMQVSSLEAAEMAETADNDLNDAYRPYNVATADAGLTTPSAPIHNET